MSLDRSGRLHCAKQKTIQRIYNNSVCMRKIGPALGTVVPKSHPDLKLSKPIVSIYCLFVAYIFTLYPCPDLSAGAEIMAVDPKFLCPKWFQGSNDPPSDRKSYGIQKIFKSRRLLCMSLDHSSRLHCALDPN